MKGFFLFFLVIIFAFGLIFQVQADVGSVDTQGTVEITEEEETPAPTGGGGSTCSSPRVFSDSLVINPSTSSGQVQGQEYASLREVELKLKADSALYMSICNNNYFSGCPLEAYQETKSWTLTEGDGEKTVYAVFVSNCGANSVTVSDTIILKTAAEEEIVPEEEVPAEKKVPPEEEIPEEMPKEEEVLKKPIVRAPEIIKKISEEVKEISEKIKEAAKKIVKLFKPKPPEIKPPEIPVEKLVPKEVPPVFTGKWDLLSPKAIGEFVLSPLPKEIRMLAQKFPELGETFEEVGITKITDVEKLKTVKMTLPGLTERVGLPTVKIEPGKFALPQGIPVAELSPEAKEQIPTEIVFAKTGGELIDFNIALSIAEKSEPQQKITTVSGKPLNLTVKPEKPVKTIKGYIIFKARKTEPSSFQLPLNSFVASLFFANPIFAKEHNPQEIEEVLVLMEFEYTDPDGDGIYTADIQAPLVEGEYEIITVMDYEDPDLGQKEIRLIAVVDPEGYVYEKADEKETRIPGAIISLFWLNSETKQYELWPAKEYHQENPQITDATGKYAFLVPNGSYYLKVEAPSYLIYDGRAFQVGESSGIHINIELKTKYWWLKVVDWKTLSLILVILFLAYNFYRDKIRERRLKKETN